MSGKADSWYSRGTLFRNGLCARALDRVLGEPIAGEVTHRAGAHSSTLDDPLRSSSLRLECADGRPHHVFGDASCEEVVTDQGVSRASSGEHLRAASGKALVVDSARPNQASHGLAARGRSNPSTRETIGKFLLGQSAAPERASGLRQRIVPDELSTHPPCPKAVELDADVQPRRQHGLRRQRSPVLPVEGDLHLPAGPPE